MDASQAIHGLAVEDDTLISIRETLINVMRQFGGPKGLASLLKIDFDAAEVGSRARLNVVLDVIRLLHKYGAEFDKRHQASMEDIQAQFSRMMTEVLAPVMRENGIPDDQISGVIRRLHDAV